MHLKVCILVILFVDVLFLCILKNSPQKQRMFLQVIVLLQAHK